VQKRLEVVNAIAHKTSEVELNRGIFVVLNVRLIASFKFSDRGKNQIHEEMRFANRAKQNGAFIASSFTYFRDLEVSQLLTDVILKLHPVPKNSILTKDLETILKMWKNPRSGFETLLQVRAKRNSCAPSLLLIDIKATQTLFDIFQVERLL